jgi:predicted TIM-barrel fold metal-dependent hydrolase
LPITVELAKACDNTQMVLNHCGVPDIAGGGLDPWRQDNSDLAALPNVTCNISDLLAYCAPGTQSLATIRPWLDHVVEVFGPDRIVWGSDWPVVNLGGGLAGWLAISREYFAGLGPDVAAKLANANARQIYRL